MPSTTPHTSSFPLFYTLYSLLSLLAVYYMKIAPEHYSLNDQVMTLVTTQTFPQTNLPLRTKYTGISSLDLGLSFLVGAFMPGIAGWDEGFWLLDVHFLFGFAPVIAVMAVESLRRRNRGAVVSLTPVFALLYQTVAGAVIIPIYFAFWTYTTSRPDYYNRSTRAVPLSRARTLSWALGIGYLLPTILLFLPWGHETRQGVIALWQPSPLFVNALSFIFTKVYDFAHTPTGQSNDKSAAKSSTAQPNTGPADVPYLKTIYISTSLVAFLAHIVVVYTCLTSSSTNPQQTFTHVFYPDLSRGYQGLTEGLHFVFAADWVLVFAGVIVWSAQGVWSAQAVRDLGGKGGGIVDGLKVVLGIMLGSVVVGPGALLAGVWWWREGVLVQMGREIEGKGKEKGEKKGRRLW